MAGHSAVLLSDGREAIARFKAEPFDLVLTDLAMPGVNGWQLENTAPGGKLQRLQHVRLRMQ